MSANDAAQISNAFTSPESRDRVRRTLELWRQNPEPAEIDLTPSVRGETLTVPRLHLRVGEQLELFTENRLIHGEWELESFDPRLGEAEFPRDVDVLRRARISMDASEHISIDPYRDLGEQLVMKLFEGLRRVKQREFAGLLKDADRFRTPDPDDACGMVFQEGSYAYDRIYQGAIQLHKHFFPVIGKLWAAASDGRCAFVMVSDLAGLKAGW